MQREGRLKYAITAGKYRSGSDDSDEPSSAGHCDLRSAACYHRLWRHAVLGRLSVWRRRLGFGLGELGSLSADITATHTTLNNGDSHNGQSYRVQYSKDFQTTDTSFTLAAYRYSTAGFYTFQESNDLRADTR